MTELRLRGVTADDARQLWTWRNEAVVRANAFSTESVSWDDHVSWFSRKLADAGCRIWILEDNQQQVGQVRYDVLGDIAEIDYSIAPAFRGLGFASELLRLSAPLACRQLGVRALTGLVKQDNVPSARAFVRAGFRLAAAIDRQGVPCQLYEKDCDGV